MTNYRKAMYECGIRFVVFTRDDEDRRRIEKLLNCRFIAWLE
jgi:hypothetical protein